MSTIEELETLRQDNADKAKQIIQRGYSLDVMSMLKMRLDVLTDHLLGDTLDDINRLAFEIRYETEFSGILDAMVEQTATPSLVLPGQTSIHDAL